MKKLLPNVSFRGIYQAKSRFIDLGIVFLILLFVLGCGVSSSGFKYNRNRRNDTMRSTPTPERAATNQSATTSDSQLTTALVSQTARFFQANSLGDKTAITQLMADDFSYYSGINARSYNRQELIEATEKESGFVSVTIKNARIIESDDATATMEYLRTMDYTKQTESSNCRSSFIKSGTSWLMQELSCSKSVVADK